MFYIKFICNKEIFVISYVFETASDFYKRYNLRINKKYAMPINSRSSINLLLSLFHPSAANINLKLDLPTMTLLDLPVPALRIQSKQNVLSQSPNLYQRVISIGAVKNVRPRG